MSVYFVYVLLAVLLLPVYLFIPFFILMLLLYFSLFVHYVNKSIVLFFRTLLLLLPVYFFIPFFYTDVVAKFFFIRSLCKQVHCFVLRTFVYYFNNTISIFVTIHTWLIITIFRLGLQSSFLYHLCCVAEHKYIQNWPLQPFSQDYVLVSHATYVVCVNFICDWRDLTV